VRGLVASLASLVALATFVLVTPPALADAARPIVVVGAENEYANVARQLGGRYVEVSAVLKNPNTDPHTFEASAQVARLIARAQLIVQNGVGYDSFMNTLEAASPSSSRRLVVAQHVLRLPNDTPNPHLWYKPATMPAVARAVAHDLEALAPRDAAYFRARLVTFDDSLQPWKRAIATFRARYAGDGVAVTEPVADYLLGALGLKILTPFRFQADIMNGVDPSPQDVSTEQELLSDHRVKVFCYNVQVVDALTESLRQSATSAHVPVVGVYETMPAPGYDYQSWMLAEVNALSAALAHTTSTTKL